MHISKNHNQDLPMIWIGSNRMLSLSKIKNNSQQKTVPSPMFTRNQTMYKIRCPSQLNSTANNVMKQVIRRPNHQPIASNDVLKRAVHTLANFDTCLHRVIPGSRHLPLMQSTGAFCVHCNVHPPHPVRMLMVCHTRIIYPTTSSIDLQHTLPKLYLC